MDAVNAFFAERIFGPARHNFFESRLDNPPADQTASPAVARRAKLAATIEEIRRKQDNLLTQLEDQEPTGDSEIDREFRDRIRRRFADLTRERREHEAELAKLRPERAEPSRDDPSLLDELPYLAVDFDELADEQQRRLYDAFQLQLRYNRPRHELVIRVAIHGDALSEINWIVGEVADPSQQKGKSVKKNKASVTHAQGAPHWTPYEPSGPDRRPRRDRPSTTCQGPPRRLSEGPKMRLVRRLRW